MRRKRSVRLNVVVLLVCEGWDEDRKTEVLVFVCRFGVEICDNLVRHH